MKHARGLRKQFSLFVLGIAGVIFLVYGAAFAILYRMNEARTRVYVESLADTAVSSLTEFAANLALAGHSFSFNPFLSSLILGQSRERSLSDIETIFALSRTVVNFNHDALVDIMAVDLSGKSLSLFAGVDEPIAAAIRSAYDFSDKLDVSRRFLVFPAASAASAYMIYLVPIFDTAPPYQDEEKIATAVFVVSKTAALDRILLSVDPGVVAFYLTDSAGARVSSNAGGDDDGLPVRAGEITRRVEALGMELRAYRAFSFDKTGAFLVGYFAFSFLLLIGVFSATVFFVDRSITRPITKLHNEMERIGEDPANRRVSGLGSSDMDRIAQRINALLDQADASSKLIMETRRSLHESELRKNEAELYALQSQVNPHFLYNTLQCVRGIAIHHGIGDIAYIALALSELFRYSIKSPEQVLVADELAVIRHYLKIMDIRYSGRFSYSIDIDDCLLDRTMPKMALQPLVENAIIHGLEGTDAGGRIEIEGRVADGLARLSVRDNGTGIPEERLAAIRAALDDEYRAADNAPFMGLNNIHRRIRLRYGPRSGLSIESDGGTTAVLTFPSDGGTPRD